MNIWQDGFSMDDGELRDFNDPENRRFVEQIMRGYAFEGVFMYKNWGGGFMNFAPFWGKS